MTDPAQHLTPGTVESEIVRVLYSNPDDAFTVTEITDRIDHEQKSVENGASRLVELEVVEQTDDDLFQALDREELRRYVSSLDQLDRMFETCEDGRDWDS